MACLSLELILNTLVSLDMQVPPALEVRRKLPLPARLLVSDWVPLANREMLQLQGRQVNGLLVTHRLITLIIGAVSLSTFHSRMHLPTTQLQDTMASPANLALMDSSSSKALFKYFDTQKNILSLFREIIILSPLVISMFWIVALSSSRNKVPLIPPLLTRTRLSSRNIVS